MYFGKLNVSLDSGRLVEHEAVENRDGPAMQGYDASVQLKGTESGALLTMLIRRWILDVMLVTPC